MTDQLLGHCLQTAKNIYIYMTFSNIMSCITAGAHLRVDLLVKGGLLQLQFSFGVSHLGVSQEFDIHHLFLTFCLLEMIKTFNSDQWVVEHKRMDLSEYHFC